MDAADALQSRLQKAETKREEQQQLNAQLQEEYDDLLKKLAEAELTIDRLRLGVNTRVNKTVVYELAEREGRLSQSPADNPYGAGAHAHKSQPSGQSSGIPSVSRSLDSRLNHTHNNDVPVASDDYHSNDESQHSLSYSHRHEPPSIADRSTSSASFSILTPGRQGSLDSQYLAMILHCQSLQDDIEALLRRLEQTPEHERRRDAPAVRTEFAGLQRRFADLEGNLERLQQAKQQQGAVVSAAQPLEDEMAILREMLAALQEAFFPGEPLQRPLSQPSHHDASSSVLHHHTASPDSADSMADIPSIGDYQHHGNPGGDLSQYGRSLMSDDETTPIHSPAASLHRSPSPESVLQEPHCSDNASSPLSSSPLPPRPVSSSIHGPAPSRRPEWQSSDSESASAVSHGSRRRPPMPQYQDGRVSSHSLLSADSTPRLYPHNGLPSHTSALPGADVGYVPAVSQTGPHPGHNPLLAHHHHAPATANSGQLPPGVLQHANGTDGLRGPDSRSSSAHPLGQTASLSPSLGELDSGYTGSERPSLTLRQYASPHQPLRSSTGSELAPIASQSSLATNVNPLSSRSSHSISNGVHLTPPSRRAAPRKDLLTSPSVSSMSTNGGRSLSDSPSPNSTMINLRADLARFRQQLLQDSSSSSPTTSPSPPPHSQPPVIASPAVHLPASLSNSSEASEALRNLLDSAASSSRSPPGSRRRTPRKLAASQQPVVTTTQKDSHSQYPAPKTASVASSRSHSPLMTHQYSSQPVSHAPSGLQNGESISSASHRPVEQQHESNYFPRESGGISSASDSSTGHGQVNRQQDQPVAQPLPSRYQHPYPQSNSRTPSRKDLPVTRQPRTAHDAWQPAANSTPFATPGRSVSTQTRHARQTPARATPVRDDHVPTSVYSSFSTPSGSPRTQPYDTYSPQTPQGGVRPQHTAKATQTPREKAVSWKSNQEDVVSDYGHHSASVPLLHLSSDRGTEEYSHANAGVQTLPGYHSGAHTSGVHPGMPVSHAAYSMQSPVYTGYPAPPPQPAAVVQPAYTYQPYASPSGSVVYRSSVPAQPVYQPAVTVPYLDELDLTEANRQALLLKRKSQGIVRNLSDSLSYHSIAS